MTKKNWNITLYCTLFFLFYLSNAVALPTEGTKEATLTGGFNRDIGSGTGNLNINGELGYYIDPMIEVGIRQGFFYTLQEDASDIWRASTAPFFDYHFRDCSESQIIVPFAGLFVGAVWNESDFTGYTGPDLGIKAYVNKSTFFTARYNYEWFFDELDENQNDINSAHIITVGLGYNWS